MKNKLTRLECFRFSFWRAWILSGWASLVHSHRCEHERFRAMMPIVFAKMKSMAHQYQKSIDIAAAKWG